MLPAPSALAKGLAVLQMLVDEPGPLTASEIGRRMGMHQSSISRILGTLAEAGFAQRVAHGFVPDFGVLSLSASSLHKYALAYRPRAALAAAAAAAPGHTFALSVLWRGQIIYFLRSRQGQETRVFDADGRWPLHLSGPGMRLLLQLPEDEAVELLSSSRDRLGWARPGPQAPTSPRDALERARRADEHDCVILDDWQAPGRRTSGIAVALEDSPPVALSMAGDTSLMGLSDARLTLHAVRRDIEAALADDAAAVASVPPHLLDHRHEGA